MKTIKLVAVIDGDVTDLGRCHPGQARIMQKRGMAEFRDGKLWLRETSKPPLVENASPISRMVEPATPSDVVVRYFTPPPRSNLELDDEALLEAGVEPGDWQELLRYKPDSHARVQDVVLSTISGLLSTYLERVALGHQCYALDDVMQRQFGFLDEDTSEYVCVAAHRLLTLQISDSVAAPFGVSPVDLMLTLQTCKGRESLFGVSPMGTQEAPPPDGDIQWGGVPSLDEVMTPPVGLSGLFNRELPPPNHDGETIAERAQRKREQTPQIVVVPGWTHFVWPDAFSVIPVLKLAENGALTTYPAPGGPTRGIYRRVSGGRLYRVWLDGSGWDLSQLQADGTYLLHAFNSPDAPASTFREHLAVVMGQLGAPTPPS